MKKELAAERIRELAGAENVRIDEPMSDHTSFRVGGPADILVFPRDAAAMAGIIRYCSGEGIPFFVMGNGTNLVVRDKGIRGVVIKMFQNFDQCVVNGDVIEAGAGILLSKLANIALRHQLEGLEFAAGIPGTLGGAVAMNAGAYGGEMKDVVVWTEYMDTLGDIQIIEGKDHAFGYRTSYIQKSKGIVLRSRLQLKKGDESRIKALMEDLAGRRKDKQPLEMPSAGSVFKRPEGHFAGKLVEDCGLRGCTIGGAQVSAKHCGFIVNAGGATAEDILKLIHHIQHGVKARFQVDLETEIRIIGEE